MPTEKELLYSNAGYDAPIVPVTDKSLIYSDAGYSFTPEQQSAWQQAIGKWRQTVNDFDIATAQLRMQAADPAVQADPALNAQAQQLLARADSLGPKVTAIRASVDDVIAAMSGAWDSVIGAWDSAASFVGLNGLRMPSGRGTLAGLGLPILIPIAAVIASIALVTAFLVDYAKFSKQAALATQRGRVYADRIAAGDSPDVAARYATSAVPAIADAGGLFSFTVGGVPWWVWAIAAGGAWWFLGKRRS